MVMVPCFPPQVSLGELLTASYDQKEKYIQILHRYLKRRGKKCECKLINIITPLYMIVKYILME